MGKLKKQKAAMSSTRIYSLRRKFMLISMLSFMIVMLFTGSLVNLAISHATRSQMDDVLEELIQNDGVLPDEPGQAAHGISSTLMDQFNSGMRYFTVIFDSEEELEEGNTEINLEHVGYIDEDAANKLARIAMDNFFPSGRVKDFYFRIGRTSEGRMIIAFVNSSIQTNIRFTVIRYTVLICGAGLFLTGIVMWIFSKHAIRSEIENMNRQKEFITNASHELKTPLAVIRANTEILEMMSGENEWTESTLRQIEHMNSLIQNLVMISRSAEQNSTFNCRELDFSKITTSVAEPYRSVALKEHKDLKLQIEEEVLIQAEETTIRQLVSILTDNAFKYCDPEGSIEVKLEKIKRGKFVSLTVSNSYKDGGNVDCKKFFDRFYREDSSHNNQKGFGIGLSMAESICKQHRGKIYAEWKEGIITFTCVLPV